MHKNPGFAMPLATRRMYFRAVATAMVGLSGCTPIVDDSPLPPTTATGAAAQREAALPPNVPILFYVTAPDCPECEKWQQNVLPIFEASSERSRLRFIVLHSPTLRKGSGLDMTWPPQYRWVRDRAMAEEKAWQGYKFGLTRFTPLFVLIHGDRYVAGGSNDDWLGVVLPAIRREERIA